MKKKIWIIFVILFTLSLAIVFTNCDDNNVNNNNDNNENLHGHNPDFTEYRINRYQKKWEEQGITNYSFLVYGINIERSDELGNIDAFIFDNELFSYRVTVIDGIISEIEKHFPDDFIIHNSIYNDPNYLYNEIIGLKDGLYTIGYLLTEIIDFDKIAEFSWGTIPEICEKLLDIREYYKSKADADPASSFSGSVDDNNNGYYPTPIDVEPLQLTANFVFTEREKNPAGDTIKLLSNRRLLLCIRDVKIIE